MASSAKRIIDGFSSTNVLNDVDGDEVAILSMHKDDNNPEGDFHNNERDGVARAPISFGLGLFRSKLDEHAENDDNKMEENENTQQQHDGDLEISVNADGTISTTEARNKAVPLNPLLRMFSRRNVRTLETEAPLLSEKIQLDDESSDCASKSSDQTGDEKQTSSRKTANNGDEGPIGRLFSRRNIGSIDDSVSPADADRNVGMLEARLFSRRNLLFDDTTATTNNITAPSSDTVQHEVPDSVKQTNEQPQTPSISEKEEWQDTDIQKNTFTNNDAGLSSFSSSGDNQAIQSKSLVGSSSSNNTRSNIELIPKLDLQQLVGGMTGLVTNVFQQRNQDQQHQQQQEKEQLTEKSFVLSQKSHPDERSYRSYQTSTISGKPSAIGKVSDQEFLEAEAVRLNDNGTLFERIGSRVNAFFEQHPEIVEVIDGPEGENNLGFYRCVQLAQDDDSDSNEDESSEKKKDATGTSDENAGGIDSKKVGDDWKTNKDSVTYWKREALIQKTKADHLELELKKSNENWADHVESLKHIWKKKVAVVLEVELKEINDNWTSHVESLTQIWKKKVNKLHLQLAQCKKEGNFSSSVISPTVEKEFVFDLPVPKPEVQLEEEKLKEKLLLLDTAKVKEHMLLEVSVTEDNRSTDSSPEEVNILLDVPLEEKNLLLDVSQVKEKNLLLFDMPGEEDNLFLNVSPVKEKHLMLDMPGEEDNLLLDLPGIKGTDLLLDLAELPKEAQDDIDFNTNPLACGCPLNSNAAVTSDLTPDQVKRYSRQLLLTDGFGVTGQKKLLSSKVLVVGAGGIGSTVLPYLAAGGVGSITVIDHDKVDRSNLHRQIIHSEDSLSMNKAVSACNALKALNPSVNCVPIQMHFSPENALELVTAHDVVVDATDNPQTRYLINDACVLSGSTPLISGSAMGTEGQLSVYNYRGSNNAGGCYRCLYPKINPAEGCKSCSDNGVLGPVPGLIGILQAMEVIKILTGIGSTMHDKLVMYDSLRCSFLSIKKPPSKSACPVCGPSPTITTMKESHTSLQTVRGPDGIPLTTKNTNLEPDLPPRLHISCRQFDDIRKSGTPHVLLDVRAQQQFDICSMEGSVNIPLAELESRMTEVKSLSDEWNKKVFVLCRRGVKSVVATRMINGIITHDRGDDWTMVHNIIGGLTSWVDEVDSSIPMY